MKKLLLLIALFTISSANAYTDEDSVLKMLKTGLSDFDKSAQEFSLVQNLPFAVNSFKSELSQSSSIGSCSALLDPTLDHSDERVIESGKKMKLAVSKYVKNARTSGYIFLLSYPNEKIYPDGKKGRSWLTIACTVPAEEFDNYTIGKLKNDLENYFVLPELNARKL